MQNNPNDRRDGLDRRTGKDRREVEDAPPTGRERRHTVEPRMPEVTELDMTAEEWEALTKELNNPT